MFNGATLFALNHVESFLESCLSRDDLAQLDGLTLNMLDQVLHLVDATRVSVFDRRLEGLADRHRERQHLGVRHADNFKQRLKATSIRAV